MDEYQRCVCRLISWVGQHHKMMVCQKASQHRDEIKWMFGCVCVSVCLCVSVCVYGYVNFAPIMLCKLVNHGRKSSDMFAFNSKLVNKGETPVLLRQLI